jgi:hypothetical protein
LNMLQSLGLRAQKEDAYPYCAKEINEDL